MTAGDWAPGSRLVVDYVLAHYNDEAAPPSLSGASIQWRVLLPSGGLTDARTYVHTATTGSTSQDVLDVISAALTALQSFEGLTPTA